MMEDEKPLVDQIGDIDFSKGHEMTEEEILQMEEMAGEDLNKEPQGAVCCRLPDPDGRVVCIDCYETMERPSDGKTLIFMTAAFRFVFEGKAPVCGICEKIIKAEDAHFCQTTESILRYIRFRMEEPGTFPPDKIGELTDLMFYELRKKGVYTECAYHPDHCTIRFPEKDVEDE